MPVRNPRGGVGRLATLLVLLACLSAGSAQTLLPPDPSKTIGGKVSFDGFVDQDGHDVAARLAAADGSTPPPPWIVSPIYTRCRFTCSPITAALRSALQASGLPPSDYRVVSFSFDPEETGESLRAFREALQLPDSWLTWRATDAGSLARTLTSLDFRTIKMGGGQYAHPNLIAVLAPDRRLSEYVFGVTFSSTQLASALQAARNGGTWLRGWRNYLLVFSGVGLLVSAFIFFTLLLKRRRA